MDSVEFDKLVKETRLSEDSRKAARAVLVDERSRTWVESEFGISRQRIHQILKTIDEAKEKLDVKTNTVDPSYIAVSASLEVIAANVRSEYGDQVKLKEVDPLYNGGFSGPIVGKTQFHVAQDVGRNEFVLHSLGRLEQVPAIGASIKLNYENGRATIQPVAEKQITRSHSR